MISVAQCPLTEQTRARRRRDISDVERSDTWHQHRVTFELRGEKGRVRRGARPARGVEQRRVTKMISQPLQLTIALQRIRREIEGSQLRDQDALLQRLQAIATQIERLQGHGELGKENLSQGILRQG